MKTEMIYSSNDGYLERYEYSCPCGKGKIVEEHDNAPGFQEHYVKMYCDECRNTYEIDESKGVRGWKLLKK